MKLFPRRAQLQEMERRTADLAGQVDRYRKVQELLVNDILSLQEVDRAYTGNDYKVYEFAVKSISDKYCNLADWGCTQTGAIIDLRAAFILGEGVQVSATTPTRAEAERELKWTNDFFAYNGLDAEMSQEIAKEAEIEGKVALNIIFDKDPYGADPKGAPWPGMVSTRFIPWTSKRYVVITDPNDYLWYKKLTWNATGVTTNVSAGSAAGAAPENQIQPAGSLTEEQFVYKKFGGRIYDPNDAQPKIMKCLTQVDRLDKALRDLRQINHLFAAPTPDFEMADLESVKTLLAQIENINWKTGKLVVHTGTFSYKVPPADGVENLLAEIEMCIKVISGTTGIPIHYLGLLDLLKNRATGDNTRELVMAATAREREIWLGAYQELIEKAMVLFNENAYAQMSTAKKLDPSKVRVEIPEITQEHWDHIEKVLIPAATGGIISKEYVASQIPGVDMETEAERKETREAAEAEAEQKAMEALKEQNAEQAPVPGAGLEEVA